jgi:hypothetical protein
MKKFAFAAVLGLAVVSYALAEDVAVLIGKVDGDKITYKKKGKKGEDPGPDMTATVAANVKVVKGMFDKDAGKLVEGEAVTDGVKNQMFKDAGEKAVGATITIADDGADKGKITKIVVGGKGGGKKKGA